MKSAILISPGVLEINAKAGRPVPGPGEVVVKVRAALTCGTDVKTYLRGHPKIPLPSPLGHEFSGDVVEAGEGVTGLGPGTPVMAVHTAPCGECPMCRRGRENLCKRVMEEKVLGAFAEYIKLPERVVRKNLFRKPDGLSYAEAAMLEPLACVAHGLNAVKNVDYGSVLVIGAGPIGLLHLILHKRNGRKVIVAGRGEARLKLARELGADVVVDNSYEEMAWSVIEATEGLGADLVVEAAGSREMWEASPRLARPGGTVLLFGGCPADTRACFEAARLHYDEITLIGAFHFTPGDVKEAYELLAGGRINVRPLISGEYKLDDLKTAFDHLIAKDGIKYVITP